MAIEENLYQHIVDNIATVGGRVYPQNYDQPVTLPCITYRKVSGPRLRVMGGRGGLTWPRFQVVSWAMHYREAKELAEEVRLLLDGIDDEMDGEPCDVSLMNEYDLYDTDARWYGVGMDFEIWHQET